MSNTIDITDMNDFDLDDLLGYEPDDEEIDERTAEALADSRRLRMKVEHTMWKRRAQWGRR